MNKNKVVTLGMAMGCSVSKCVRCQALLAYGVNSVETMKAFAAFTGRPTFGANYAVELRRHAKEHAQAGDEIRVDWTEAGLTDEFKAKLVPPPAKPVFIRTTKPVFIRPVENHEASAKAAFQDVLSTKQVNARTAPEPVRHLNTGAFADPSWK